MWYRAAGGKQSIRSNRKKRNKDKHLNIEVDLTGCIGMCYLEPSIDKILMMVKNIYVKVTPEIIPEIIESHLEKKEVAAKYQISELDAQY